MKLTQSETAHRTAGLGYCLWLLGILFGVTALIGVIINHKKLASVRGTHAHSHLLWQIVSFWTVFAGVVLSVIFWPGTFAQTIAVISFFIWIFSAMIGSWYLSKSRGIKFIDREHHRPDRHAHGKLDLSDDML